MAVVCLTKCRKFLTSSNVLKQFRAGKCGKTFKVVMVRHGQSEWNEKNLFCGWFDAQLTCKGQEEAKNAGKALKCDNFCFDIAYTSVLTRAINTLDIILKELCQQNIKIVRTWRLNERHYGGLTGLNKAETAKKYGEEQVQIWRRSFDTPPPPMKENHPYYKQIVCDDRYKNEPKSDEFPMCESLELTIKRTLPFWNDVITPMILSGKQVIIAAHGNSLRGIVKHLDRIDNQAIMKLNLPTGIPFIYELDENMCVKKSMQFLGDPETVKKAMEEVAAQGKKK